MVTHLQDYSGRDHLKKSCWDYDGEKGTELRMPVCASTARSLPIGVVDDIKICWREEKL